jgi:CRP-like cAMP-binding protein
MRDITPIATRTLLTLRQFPGLAETELAELAMVATNVHEQTFAAGATVAVPGERVPALQLVLDGQIAAIGPRGHAAAWGPRSVFGALEVMAGRPVAVPAVAVSATRTLQIAGADFVEILEDNYSLLSNARRGLAGRLVQLAETLGQSDVGERGRVPSRAPVTRGPLGMVDRLILMRPQIPFAIGKIQALAALAAASEELEVPAGTVIAREGERAEGAWIIVEGEAMATRPRQVPRVLGPGHAIGRLETLAERGHSLTVETITPARVLACPGSVLFDVMEDHTDLALAMVAALAGELLDIAARRAAPIEPWGPS